MANDFLELLSQINDPRRAQGKKWQLGPVLLATILAILSGATSYRKVHGFIKTHRKRLNRTFGFRWKAAPAYSAVRTILRGLDGAEVERVFRAHAVKLNTSKSGGDVEGLAVVAIDGKALRHSFDAFNDKKAAHILSAFSVGKALILGHVEVDEKSNEIPAAQALIEALALRDRLFTLDAMHGRRSRLRQRAKKTFKAVLKSKSHLLVQVKDNQPCLLRVIEAIVEKGSPVSCHESTDQNQRSRDEARTVEVFEPGAALEGTGWGGFVAHIIKVTRSTLLRNAKDRSWDVRADISFYVCTTPLSAAKAAAAIRNHWHVENKNHYVRDVAMQEDASRIRINPGIFARARSFALNILRANGETNIADAMWNNVLDIKRPLKYRYI